jgi:hypothetical protein
VTDENGREFENRAEDLSKNSEVVRVLKKIEKTKSLFEHLVADLPSFEVTSAEALPYGLKPHTRSVSWLVEQVIVQRLRAQREVLQIDSVDYDLPDTELHDVELLVGQSPLYVNIKCHQAEKKQNKNDISAVVKLYQRYMDNPDYDLLYASIGIRFEGRFIRFLPEHIACFSPQFLPLYVNPTNDKIQAFYNHQPVLRTRDAFLTELKTASKTLKL